MKRFASHSEEDIIAKRQNLVPTNTVKANKAASNLFRSYLEEKNMETNFEMFDVARLAETLSHLYMDARTKSGDLYKATTLTNTRHALNRYLKSPPYLKKIDIISSPEFSEANECYKTAMAEIKAAGKGDITHYPELESEDLTKLYNNIYMDPSTPTGLANRVQMNARLYFCRRANENMESMTKDTFVIRIYSVTGRRYVMKKVDELTKNRREMDRENISGHMPEDREMPEYCPVRNFETYLQKLHPQCNRLWQFPKDSFNISDECWFQKRPIGKDTLASFMSTLSKTNRPFTNLHQPLHSCNGCNYPRKKLFNGTNYGSYRTQICLVSCSISTCFIKGKTSYGRHYHKFCSWRATISTILNNATAQYFPVATHAADTKQFKFK